MHLVKALNHVLPWLKKIENLFQIRTNIKASILFSARIDQVGY